MSRHLSNLRNFACTGALLAMAACSSSTSGGAVQPATVAAVQPGWQPPAAPSPDPRVDLRAGGPDGPAAEAIWNLRLLSNTPSPAPFAGVTNSDLAFTGKYAIQGNYNGYQVWDISNPKSPMMTTSYLCPASQSDVSVAGNLLFVSGEGLGGRVDCGTQGVPDTVSMMRLRGIRIFDITDISNPKYLHNVQTCRGSHTHTVLDDPADPDNVYVYISGSSSVRSPNELAGCSGLDPEEDPNSARFRIEVIKVPRANPTAAAIVSSPRIFEDLDAPPVHGASPADEADNAKALAAAKARGAFTADIQGNVIPLPDGFVKPMLDSIVEARNGTGDATSADSAALRTAMPNIIAALIGGGGGGNNSGRSGPSQCHDITVYPAIGLAGGACGGYGLLLDISDPANPVRIGAVADSNFSYWHSATFTNDGSKVLFTDEWGGGGAPKCRAGDPMEWGANALFTIENRKMVFKSYYKLPAIQTSLENCVAHNGSLIPIPGRDVMVQGWYQGGISIFDWTDAENPVEIAFHDRGPIDGTQMGNAGSWSVYWYNGVIVSSEINRGLDIFELTPSGWLSQNEIDASNTVIYEELNAQGQPQFSFPASFALAGAYLDQLWRSEGLASGRITRIRAGLARAERASGQAQREALTRLANSVNSAAQSAPDQAKVRLLGAALADLAGSAR